MLGPQHYVSSPGNFFLDLDQIAIAMKGVDGKLIVHLKNAAEPIIINCEEMQTEAIIASVIGWNHHGISKQDI